jgi:hypothetical protein
VLKEMKAIANPIKTVMRAWAHQVRSSPDTAAIP